VGGDAIAVAKGVDTLLVAPSLIVGSQEDLDDPGGGPHLHRFVHELVRHAVVTPLILDVVVNVDSRVASVGELIAHGRQRLQ
jgi:hypothetical protein